MNDLPETVLTVGLPQSLEALNKLPVHLLAARSGEHALQLLRAADPNLVISSWLLPDMTAEILFRNIMFSRPDLATLVVVNAAEPDEEIDARGSGASAVVHDNIQDTELCRVVEQLLSSQAAASVT